MSHAFLIPLLIVLCGIIAAIAVFSIMGHVAHVGNQQIEDIPLSGPELAFVAFPAGLLMMPYPNFWSILFFLTLVLLGIDT